MARPVRAEYPGSYHHVTTRGVVRGEIFLADADRLAFLSRLAEAHQRWGLVCYGYCLMTNHYHVEVELPSGGLSEAFGWINQNHALFVNRRTGRDGSLFQGRFKSVLVEAGSHLHELTRYTHLNPVRAGMVEHPADYRWSSYRAYLGLRQAPAWRDVATTLSRFGTTGATQRQAYREFVERPEEVTQDPLREMEFGAVLGTQKFVKWFRATFCDEEKERPIAHFKQARPQVDVEAICAAVARDFEVPESSLTLRGKHHNEARDVALYLARQQTRSPLATLGARFGGVAPSAVTMACRRTAESWRTTGDSARESKSCPVNSLRVHKILNIASSTGVPLVPGEVLERREVREVARRGGAGSRSQE